MSKPRRLTVLLTLTAITLVLLSACQSLVKPRSPTDLPPENTAVTATDTPDAWTQARSLLPLDVRIYKPMYVPPRFGPPQLLEVQNNPASGPRYTIVYSAPGENLAFILNMGQGAFGNFPPPERQTPMLVLDMPALLLTSTETHTMGVSWQAPTGTYQVNAYSSRMTPDELKEIIDSLVEE